MDERDMRYWDKESQIAAARYEAHLARAEADRQKSTNFFLLIVLFIIEIFGAN